MAEMRAGTGKADGDDSRNQYLFHETRESLFSLNRRGTFS